MDYTQLIIAQNNPPNQLVFDAEEFDRAIARADARRERLRAAFANLRAMLRPAMLLRASRKHAPAA